MFSRFLLITLLLLSNMAVHADTPACLGDTMLEIKDAEALVEVAATERERRYGLMFRRSMGENCGMLFVFQNSGYRTFTMQNTLIPLDIAFISKEGVIREIFSMQPGVPRYPSTVESAFALEMNEGWFAANALNVGDTIQLKNEDSAESISVLRQ